MTTETATLRVSTPSKVQPAEHNPDTSIQLGMARDLLTAASAALNARYSPNVRAPARQLVSEAGELLYAAARAYVAPSADKERAEVKRGMYRLLGLTYVLVRELEQSEPTDGHDICDNPAQDVTQIAAQLAEELLAKETELFRQRHAA